MLFCLFFIPQPALVMELGTQLRREDSFGVVPKEKSNYSQDFQLKHGDRCLMTLGSSRGLQSWFVGSFWIPVLDLMKRKIGTEC